MLVLIERELPWEGDNARPEARGIHGAGPSSARSVSSASAVSR